MGILLAGLCVLMAGVVVGAVARGLAVVGDSLGRTGVLH